MKSLLIFLVLAGILSGCAALGSRTIYRTKSNLIKPSKIGFTQLANQDVVNLIALGSSEIYTNTMVSRLENSNISPKLIHFADFESLESMDPERVVDLCQDNDLDGVIFTKLIFLYVDYGMFIFPVGVSKDTIVEMVYYSSSGEKLLHTIHNTHLGNSYMAIASVEKTVEDGTIGALNRILKEISKQ